MTPAIRIETDNHHTLGYAAPWWIDRGTVPPPLGVLPRICATITLDDQPVAVAWLDMSNSSSTAYLLYPAAAPGHERRILDLVPFLESAAREYGYTHIISATHVPSLDRILRNILGYVPNGGPLHSSAKSLV